MEIISYLKGKKAQKEMKAMHQVVGQDNYKHGPQDVIDKWQHADERIGELEKKNEHRVLSDKVENLTKMVAINLNKHNLQVSSLVSAKKYKHTNMLYDDFADDTFIDKPNSSNYIWNSATSSIKKGSQAAPCIVQFKKIDTGSVVHSFIISLAVKSNTSKKKEIDLSFITNKPDNNGYYPLQEEFISPAIPMTPGSRLNEITVIPKSGDIGITEIYIATEAMDTHNFMSWQKVSSGGTSITLKEWIKIKVVFLNKKEEAQLLKHTIENHTGMIDINTLVAKYEDSRAFVDSFPFIYEKTQRELNLEYIYEQLPMETTSFVYTSNILTAIIKAEQGLEYIEKSDNSAWQLQLLYK